MTHRYWLHLFNCKNCQEHTGALCAEGARLRGEYLIWLKGKVA
jgi:hypothetical protein